MNNYLNLIKEIRHRLDGLYQKQNRSTWHKSFKSFNFTGKAENDYFRKSKKYQSLPDFGHYYPGVEEKREGKKVISFAAGEPDFPTPANIREEAVLSVNQGFTHYTSQFRHNRTQRSDH